MILRSAMFSDTALKIIRHQMMIFEKYNEIMKFKENAQSKHRRNWESISLNVEFATRYADISQKIVE